MTITMNMVADCVAGARLGPAPEGARRRFARVVSDAAGERAALGALRTPVSDALFVGDAAACAAYLGRHPTGWALCVQEEERLPVELAAFPDRAAALVTDRDAASVAAAASCRLVDVTAWVARMHRALLEDSGLQGLVDASEHMLGNALALSDSGFRIVAHTRELLPTNPLIRESIANGMFSKKALDLFRKNDRSRRWSTRTGIHLLEESEAGPVVECIFRLEGVYAAHLVMHCEWRPLTDGLLDELALLADCVELHLRRELSEGRLFDQGPARVLVDLAEGAPVPRRKLDAWLRTTGLDAASPLELAVVDYGYRDDERQLAVYAGLRLIELFPEAVVALKGSRAVLLRMQRTPAGDEAFRAALASHARAFDGRAGLSDRFERVEDARFAWRQADVALSLGASDVRAESRGEEAGAGCSTEDVGAVDEDRLFDFRDYFVPYLLTAERQDEELVARCVGRGAPARLREADRQEGTQDFDLLFTYLVCERRSSAAAERLHLHRNTLLYRVRRIEREYGIDLDRWQVRERLLAEYRILRYGA